MQLGFIGTGVITSAIVTGICTSELEVESIWVSPRNHQKADELAKKFDPVRVGDNNQMVIDNSEVVVLGILPQQMENILNEIEFRPDHIIVHLLAGIKIDMLAPLVKPAMEIVRAVPLPCVSIHSGPVAMFPENDIVCQLFDVLGNNILADNEQQLDTLFIITALMAPYYAMLENIVKWAVSEGISQKNASDYTASMFEAFSLIARELPSGNLNSLVNESMTPGGLNELAMATINDNGGFDSLIKALQKVKKKVT